MSGTTKKSQKTTNDSKGQRKTSRNQDNNPPSHTKSDGKHSVSAAKSEESRQNTSGNSNLKHETEDILQMAEADKKYSKKQIKSNWEKYEIQIESYDEIEEQENLGADYEKLSRTPLAAGGHFQFKHEKSWESSAASPYEYYFEFNMHNLSSALQTIPFYIRNDIEKSIFMDSEITTMDYSAQRHKQSFYGNKNNSGCDDKLFGLDVNTEKSDQPKTFTKFVNDEIVGNLDRGLDDVSKENEELDISISQTDALKISDYIDDLTKEVNEDQDILNKELSTNTNQGLTRTGTELPVADTAEDLEKWLDDFLDE